MLDEEATVCGRTGLAALGPTKLAIISFRTHLDLLILLPAVDLLRRQRPLVRHLGTHRLQLPMPRGTDFQQVGLR